MPKKLQTINMTEDAKVLKDMLLKESIVAKGYSIEEFMAVLAQKKEGGQDLGLWEYEELHQAVSSFMLKKQEEDEALMFTHDTGGWTKPEEEEKKNVFSSELETLKLDEQGFGSSDIRCKIVDHRLINPGLFQSQYVVYCILVEPNGVKIERRFSEFHEFRLELVRLYPGYIIPAIPKKKVGKGTDPDFIDKRKRILQYFLSELTVHPVLRASRLVKDFLTQSPREWNEALKLSKKQMAPRSAQECRTQAGRAKVEISSDLESYCRTIHLEIKEIQENYQTLKYVGKTLSKEFEKIASSTASGSLVCEKMQNIYTSLGKPEARQFFTCLGNAFKAMNSQYTKVQKSYTENLWKFMELYISELNALLELDVYNMAAKEQMTNYCAKLKKKKDQFFELKNTAKWELKIAEAPPVADLLKDKDLAFKHMLPKETEEEFRQIQIYGFYCNKMKEEFDRVTQKNMYALVGHFKEVAINHNEVNLLITEVWDGLEEDMDRILSDLKASSL